MKFGMYSIHDKLMNIYLTPFMARGDVEAVRQITAMMTDPQMRNSGLVLTPSDYSLVSCGSFDDETCIVTSDGPKVIKPLSEVVPRKLAADGSEC